MTVNTKHATWLHMLVFITTLNPCHMLVATTYNKVKIKKPKDITLIVNDSLVAGNKSIYTHTYTKTADSLQIMAICGAAQNSFKIPATSSRAYVKYRIFTLGIPLDYIQENTKRYRYADKIVIENHADPLQLFTQKPWCKGDISLNFKLPYVNYMNCETATLGRQHFLGFGGAVPGVQYYLNEHSSIAMAATFITNMTNPFLVIPMHNTTDFLYTGGVTASYHYALNKWEYGADLRYERAQFVKENDDTPKIDDQYLSNIGPHTALKYRMSYSG